MSFSEFWVSLQANLKVGENIRNWTAANGYLGDHFKVVAVLPNCVEIESPNAVTIQCARKPDFEVMYNNWESYCSQQLQRNVLVKLTRVSKYTMSIIKHLEAGS